METREQAKRYMRRYRHRHPVRTKIKGYRNQAFTFARYYATKADVLKFDRIAHSRLNQ